MLLLRGIPQSMAPGTGGAKTDDPRLITTVRQMEPLKTPDAEFLLRRISESFSDLVVVLPVLIAAAVVGSLLLLHRNKRELFSPAPWIELAVAFVGFGIGAAVWVAQVWPPVVPAAILSVTLLGLLV